MARAATFNFDIMQSGNLKAVVKAIKSRTSRAMSMAVYPVQQRLRSAIISGDSNIKGFASTNTWKWIMSPDGLGQLGFTDASQATALFDAIINSTKAMTKKDSGGKVIVIGLLNMMTIARATPHPAASTTPALKIESWFVDWILEQDSVTDAGFVELKDFIKSQEKRGKTVNKMPRSFQIAGLGGAGFMFPAGFSGSRGTWRVPAGVGGEEIRQWLQGNIPGIRHIVEDELSKAFMTLG